IRTITASRTYQLAAKPNATNAKDAHSFSRAYFRRLDAEVLLDMVSQTTGIAERFGGAPPDTRAIQLWDSKVNHYFLKLYSRPQSESERKVAVQHLQRGQRRLAAEDLAWTLMNTLEFMFNH